MLSKEDDWLSRARRWWPLVLIAAGIVAYHNSFWGPFVFDDEVSILQNPHIRQLWPPWAALETPEKGPVGGRPIANISFAINYAVSGLQVWSYHALNVILHLANGLLFWSLLRRTLDTTPLRKHFSQEAAWWLAVAASLLWLVHPLLSESVVYVTQRTELLMAFFLLITLLCVVRGSAAGDGWGWNAVAVTACALGMGCKETMVVVPLLVLVYDRMFLSASYTEALRHRWRLYAGLAATWVILIVLDASARHRDVAGFHFANLTPWDYAKTQCNVILYYLRLSFWPSPLVIDYNDWPIAREWRDFLLPGVVICSLLGMTAWAMRHEKSWGFLGTWFFLILAPSSSFLPLLTEVVAERRMYLPLMAVITGVVIGGYALVEVEMQRLLPCDRVRRRLQGAAVCLLAGVLAVVTIRRNQDYRTAISIWSDTVAKRPQNASARNDLGATLLKEKKTEEAIAQFRRALELAPNNSLSLNNLGAAYVEQRKQKEAAVLFEQALQRNPNCAEAHYNLGMLLAKQGKTEEAIQHYAQTLRLKPGHAATHYNLGVILAAQGKLTEATQHYRAALQMNPTDPQAHYNLGNALLRLGQADDAIASYQQSIHLNPNDYLVHYNLGLALAQRGKLSEAAYAYQAALRLQPDFPSAHYNLGNLYLRQSKPAEAARHYAEVIRLRPQDAQAHFYLGIALHQQAKPDEAASAFAAALRLQPAWPEALEALAAALAETGQWDEAVRSAQRALDLARAGNNSQLATTIQQRLEAYRQRILPQTALPSHSKTQD